MNHVKPIRVALLSLPLALAAFAQSQDTQSTQTTPPPPAPPAWSVGGFDIGGYVDAYANLNFNNPASGSNGSFRTFDSKANSFNLNFATLTAQKAAEPIGFRVDLGFGRGYEIFNSFEPAITNNRTFLRNLLQAFVSVKPKNAGGLQIDFGRFYTSAGAEPTETYLNWNYSRSNIYALGPFYHMGLRVSKPVTSYWTTGLQVINGWNNTEDNNTGKTFGITNAFASPKISYYNNYYVGPEKDQTNKGYRHFIDQVLSLTPHEKASFYINYDYGYEKALDGRKGIISAIAGAAKFQANPWFAISPRLEYFNDRGTWTSGTIQKLKEFTLTAEFKHSKGFMTKVEYRHDWSNAAVFDDSRGNPKKSQDTLAVGFVAYFGPK